MLKLRHVTPEMIHNAYAIHLVADSDMIFYEPSPQYSAPVPRWMEMEVEGQMTPKRIASELTARGTSSRNGISSTNSVVKAVAAARVIAYVENQPEPLGRWLRFCHAPEQFYTRTDVEKINAHIWDKLTPHLDRRKAETIATAVQLVPAVMVGYQYQAHNGSSAKLQDKHLRALLGLGRTQAGEYYSKNWARDIGSIKAGILAIMRQMDCDAGVVRSMDVLEQTELRAGL